MVGLDYFPQLKKVLMQASFKVIDEIAARIPVVLSSVEDFKLNKCSLTCLDCSVIFVFRGILLLWTVLHRSEGFDWVLLFSEERREPTS